MGIFSYLISSDIFKISKTKTIIINFHQLNGKLLLTESEFLIPAKLPGPLLT